MANLNIKFNGKEFLLSCEDGQEDHLEELSQHINEKFNQLKSKLGNLGENKLLLITSIQLMDEYFETKKKIEEKKDEVEKLKTKFKELKSLAINYKDEKEKEIDKLKQQLDKFEKTIEESRISYEEILDKTTKSIEKFIESTEADQEKNIQ